MAPALVHATSVNGNSGTSFGITIPATTAGNLLVAYLVTYTAAANPTLNVPTGWTGLAQTNQDVFINISTRAYYLPNVAGGVTSYTFTASASVNGWGLIVMEYSGVATTTPLDTSTTNAPGTGGYGFSATLSPANSGDLMVGLYYVDLVAGNTPSPVTPTNWTRAKLTTDGPGDVDIVADYATGQNTYAPTWNSSGTKVDYAYHVLAFTAAGSGPTTLTRNVPASAALLATNTRQVPASAALLATDTRTVPASAALVATDTRQVPATAALLATDTRQVPASAALLATDTRIIPTSAALIGTQTRVVPSTAALVATLTRSVPASVQVSSGFTRQVPASAALLATNTRSVPSTVALLAPNITRHIPASAALLEPNITRAVPAGAALLLTLSRAIVATAALLATDTRAVPSTAALLATQTRAVPASVVLSGANVPVVPGLCTVSDAAVAVVTLSDSAVGMVAVSDSPAEGS